MRFFSRSDVKQKARLAEADMMRGFLRFALAMGFVLGAAITAATLVLWDAMQHLRNGN